MNVSETNRHAIAIAEALCRMQPSPISAGRTGNPTSFEVEAIGDVLDGRVTISPVYNFSYRTIEVTVVRSSMARATLHITLLKQGQMNWEWARIECSIAGWVSGSLQFTARNTDQGWQVRELDCFARADSCGHFEFDYDWCEVRSLRAEKAAREAARSNS